MKMKETIRGRRSQGGLYVILMIGAFAFLFWLAPGAVVAIGKGIGKVIAWIVTNVAGAAWSLITGLVAGIGG